MITLIGIPFDFTGMTYYQTDKDINLNDSVVITTPHGTFVGKVLKMRTPTPEETEREDFNVLFPSILRIATFKDKAVANENEKKAEEISKTCQEYSNSLNLNMKVLRSYIDIEDNKVLITFTSDNRVDFRELVRILNGIFHLKIELRQIGPRDQARLVGGIGPCGLPLCCTTFITSFEGFSISINMAKNQLLAINIPKLSGQCGKLMCCLKFEDEAYSQLRPNYPKIGEKFVYGDKQYEVTGLNLLNDTITTYNGDNYESFTKDEFERVKKGLEKQAVHFLDKDKDVNSGVDLSGFGIKETKKRIAQIEKNEKKHKEDFDNKNNSHATNNNNKNNSNTSNKNNQSNFKDHNKNKSNQKNYNNNKKNNFNKPQSSHASSGFIPVSQIADKSVLDFKPVKNNDDQK